MSRLNTARTALRTHEGGRASHINPFLQLRRSASACLLWENEFYESGVSISDRIKDLVPRCDIDAVADLAVHLRTEGSLRHVPLLLAREIARYPQRVSRPAVVAETICQVIQRADELSEFLAIYWKDGKQPLSAQVKYGLAQAFRKFNEYHLAKYDRKNEIRLRDVLFLCHAKPEGEEQAALWKRLVDNELAVPDTWETNLSAGADKRETFTRLLVEKKLGYLALLRNLRNMAQAGVDETLIGESLLTHPGKSKVLPFRFIAAAKAVPNWEPMLDRAMVESMREMPRLAGDTVLLVDVSGSMNLELSAKSDLKRMDAACGLAMLLAGVCERFSVFSFSKLLAHIPPRQGMALRDAIVGSQPHGVTRMLAAIREVNSRLRNCDRFIVITDEQSADGSTSGCGERNYMINVASAKNGVGYGDWTKIDGFSESVVKFIMEIESQDGA